MNTKLLVLAATLLLASTQALCADDAPFKAEKGHNTWYQIENVNFKAGNFDKARDLIIKHFIPASKASGSPGPELILVNRSGASDLTLIWKLDGGLAEMDWEMSPDSAKFMNELAKQEGGKDKALALWKSYIDLIQDSSSTLATSL